MESLLKQFTFPSSMEAHCETRATVIEDVIYNLEAILKEETTVISEDTPQSDYNCKEYKTLLSNLRSWRQS